MLPATSLIPIRDENPTRSFSYLTVGLIAVNVLLFFTEPGFGQVTSEAALRFLFRWGVVPWEITHGRVVSISECAGACAPGKNIYFALLSSMFLHGGFLHLAGNMLFLWVFGNNIEDTLGRVRYVTFYLVTGLAAGMAHVLTNPGSIIPTLGASGAISGVLGAYIVLFPRARVHSIVPGFFLWTVNLPAVAVLGIWFFSQFFIGAGQQAGGAGVAWMAHVGGFVAGVITVFLLGGRQKARDVYPYRREPEPW
ncbi:MAG: rhomboid family intramembrane serine protease [Actinomycetota bacterium]